MKGLFKRPRALVRWNRDTVSPPLVLFLVYREGLGPIFSSVYVSPASMLAKLGYRVDIAVVSSIGEIVKPRLRGRWSRIISDAKRGFSGKITRIPSPPKFLLRFYNDSIALRFWGRLNFSSGCPDVIHCGASRATVLAVGLRKHRPSLKVVYHCWGPEAAEYRYAMESGASKYTERKNNHTAKELERAQSQAMAEANLVICISKKMEEWARKTYGVDEERTVVLPCFVDVARFNKEASCRDEIRSALGFGSEKVVAYCGSMISWQLSEESLEALLAMRDVEPDIRFLGLTMHKTSLRDMLQRVGFRESQTTILSVEHWEVPRYLAAADIGLIGRSLMQGPSVVHEVSSPIKYGEYLACGTPVMLSEGVGDFSQMTKEHGVGIVVPHFATKHQVSESAKRFFCEYDKNIGAMRQRCYFVARSYLDRDSHIDELSQRYKGLLRTSHKQAGPK